MTPATDLACGVDARRKHLFGNPDWNGLDYLEVSGDQRSLCVHFFGAIPQGIGIANVVIDGGRRIRGIRATKVEIDPSRDPELDDCLRITLDRPGDFSTYRLCLIEAAAPPAEPVIDRGVAVAASRALAPMAQSAADGAATRPFHGLDPRYACLEFSFKVDCASDLDCKVDGACAPTPLVEPDVNYLAKDYASFRQLILDRLALVMPEWLERHVPDLGITLVELLAYVGDRLSYYQDAVATEAYLDTARRRISVRRHARLVDYLMHEGSNARAWVTVATTSDLPPLALPDFYFMTGFRDVPAASGFVVRHDDLEPFAPDLYEVFEPLADGRGDTVTFYAAHSTIHFYTWGDLECCLAKGATRATLLDEAPHAPGDASVAERVLHVQAGDVLILEEVLGPTTGKDADADRSHRHPVRLTAVTPSTDPVLGRLVIEVEWEPEDALPFSLCLSARLGSPDCRWIGDVSVARGNVVLVDHGRRAGETLDPVEQEDVPGPCACEGSVLDHTRRPLLFRPGLQGAPITFAEPLAPGLSAFSSIPQDPRRGLPSIVLTETSDDGAPAATWEPRPDLLASAAADRHFVAEIDDEGQAQLRFGDGELGRQPAGGTRFDTAYRIGNGPAGNVGIGTIDYLVLRRGTVSADAITPRNPLPAQGGTAPESTAEVKLLAPYAFRSRRERAITADDYARLAERNAKVQRAAAQLRWTGSWYEARVALDPLDAYADDTAVFAETAASLFPYRRMGHDLAVVQASYVPLTLALEVCVSPHYARGAVKAALLRVFSNRAAPDGTLGFFDPDRLTFGEGVQLSRIVAAAMSVPGVETVRVNGLARRDAPKPAAGAPVPVVLPLGAMEIAQLDNDPNFQENGTLDLVLRGGR